MIITHKETALILEVTMCREPVCIKFGNNFLLQFFIKHLAPGGEFMGGKTKSTNLG